jgi:uncharacterized membrane protein YhaH (DUF805 family)
VIDPRYLFLSVEGRIPRKHFWFGAGAIALFQLAVQSPLASAGGVDIDKGVIPLWFRNLSLFLDVICAWPIYAVLAKRQQDRDQTPRLSYIFVALLLTFSVFEAFGLTQIGPRFTPLGWIVGLSLLFVFVVVIVELGCRRGTVGANAHGRDPLA